jgi:hypothetical protein
MKGMKNVEVASPVPTAPLKKMTGGAKSGNVGVASGAKTQSFKSTSQPNTKAGKVVSPTKSK